MVKKAKKWVYDLTIHNSVELMASPTEDSAWQARDESQLRVISCDAQGQCFYDEILRPDVRPFLRLLNRKGAEGWELIQHSYHAGYLYLLWKREADE